MPAMKSGVFLTLQGLQDLLATLREVRDKLRNGLLGRAEAAYCLDEVVSALGTALEEDEGQLLPHARVGGSL